MSASNNRGLLAQADVRRFMLGQLMAEVGSRITREGLPIVAILTASATAPQLGILAALATLPALLAGNLAGRWVDRTRRRPLLIAASAARATVLLLVPGLFLIHHLDYAAIAAVTLGAETFGVLIAVARHAYLPSLVTRRRIEDGNQLMGTADAIGETTGPGLMGVLIQSIGAPFSIVFDALANFFAAASLLTITHQEEMPIHLDDNPEEHASPETIRQVWQRVGRHPVLRPLLLNAGASAFFGGFFSTLYELYVLKTLHVPALWLGILITLGGLGSLAGTALFSRIRRTFSLGAAVFGGYVVYAVLNASVPMAHGRLWTAVGFLCIAQFGGDLFATVSQIAATTVEQQVTPDHWLGRVHGTFRALAGGLEVLGALVAGPLAVALSPRSAFWIATLGLIAAAPLLAASKFRRLTATSHPEELTDRVRWP